MMRLLLLASTSLLASYYCHAQADSAQRQTLDEVVVTGQYSPQSVKNSVYQLRVIGRERIARQGATRLQDVLSNELNIRFSQDLATGGSNIEMMGMSGQNLKILIDGIPVIGRQGTSNEININQIDVNSIERIEMVEGPMSVIYGADALGGVINIITKKNTKDDLFVNARINEETAGNEYGLDQGTHYQYGEAGWKHKKFRLNGGIGRNYFGGWKGGSTGRELDWHIKEQLLGNIVTAYHSNRNTTHYRLDVLDEVIKNPGAFNGNEAIDQDYKTKRLMHQLQSSHRFGNKLSTQVALSYTNYNREIYSTVLKKDGTRTLAQGAGMQDLSRFSGYVARAAAVYVFSPSVSIQPGVDINLETGSGERMKEGMQRINDFAFFLTSEISLVRSLKLRPGVRVIRNSQYDAPPAVASFNALFDWSPRLKLRASYANGFRSPSLRELYFYFFDANHQIVGNTNLKAEMSNSFTGTIDMVMLDKNKTLLKSTLSGFYNDVRNLIDVGRSSQNPNVFTYINLSKYKTRGINLTNSLVIGRLQFNTGASYTGRYNQFYEHDETLSSFKWSWEANAGLSYLFAKIGLTANAWYKYTGRVPAYQVVEDNGQQQIELIQTDGYHWMDISLNKKISPVLTINAGVKNLFNVKQINSGPLANGTHSDGASRAIAYGTSAFAGIVFEWNKKMTQPK